MEEATNNVTVMPDVPADTFAPVSVQSYVEAVEPTIELFAQDTEPFLGEYRAEQPDQDIPGDLGESVIINSQYLHIKAINSSHVASKWLKTMVLRQDPRIAQHIPDTRRYSPSALSSMLSSYGKVVLKPVIGSGGVGLIMVTSSSGLYMVRHQRSIRKFGSFAALVTGLRRIRRKRKYLIQRGITLVTINGRPIDYRVKMVRKNRRWATTAMVGRLARQGLFVTNLCRGGTMMTSAEGISRSLSVSAVKGKKTEMRQLTRMCISILERAFPGVGKFGFDYGIDQNGMIWIFEVNTRPH